MCISFTSDFSEQTVYFQIFHNSLFFSLLAFQPHHDSQLVPDKQCRRFIPGETLEECHKSQRLRLFFRSTGKGGGTRKRASSHPHPSSLSHKHLSGEDLFCFCHPNRSASSLCYRISASSCRDVSGTKKPQQVQCKDIHPCMLLCRKI